LREHKFTYLVTITVTLKQQNIEQTTEPHRHTVKMYASSIIAFTHLYTYDLDLSPHDLANIFSNAHSYGAYL